MKALYLYGVSYLGELIPIENTNTTVEQVLAYSERGSLTFSHAIRIYRVLPLVYDFSIHIREMGAINLGKTKVYHESELLDKLKLLTKALIDRLNLSLEEKPIPLNTEESTYEVLGLELD